MSIQLWTEVQLSNMFEDLLLNKPDTPHLKPIDCIFDLHETDLYHFSLEDQFELPPPPIKINKSIRRIRSSKHHKHANRKM